MSFRKNHPILHAVLRGAAGFVAAEVVTHTGKKLGVSLRHGRHENADFKKAAREHPFLLGVHAAVLAPIIEEYVWREIPSIYLKSRGKDGTEPKAAIAISVVFAATHCGPHGIPVPQMVGGLNYWELHRKDGYQYSVLAHGTRNLLTAIATYVRWNKADWK